MSSSRASAEQNADLFWGVRGGGGNFGIVTEFEFRCVPLGTQVLAGPIFWPMEKSAEVLRFYRDWVADAPDELMTIVVHRKAPPLPFVPPELRGEPVVVVVCCWVGRSGRGGAVHPSAAASSGAPVVDVCEPKPFLAHQAMFDPAFPHGRWYYFKSCDVAELTDDIIDITAEHSLRIASPLTSFPIWQMGGAVSRVGRGRDRLQRPHRRLHVQHRRLHRDADAASRRSASGCATSGRPCEPWHARRLRQLPR